MELTEVWRPVAGWPYEASSLGRIRRTTEGPRTAPGRVLAPVRTAKGYLRITLSDCGRIQNRFVHVLVCAAFHGERPAGFQVRHLDGCRARNLVDNLAWGTPLDNAADRYAHGTYGTRSPRKKKKASLTQGPAGSNVGRRVVA